MTHTKTEIEGTVMELGSWEETRKGDYIREVKVIAQTKRPQKFTLHQFCNKDDQATQLETGQRYIFKGYVNGIEWENKICITKILSEQ